MGCFYSSLNRIQIQHTFTRDDISNLTQSWNILKAHDIIKFADEVLIKTINQDPSLRRFWTSKMIVDGNNYDFGDGESCLRTDLSWHVGLREHSVDFVLSFDKLLSLINDENLLQTSIRSLHLLQNFSILEHDSLLIMKQCIMETIRERFQLLKYDFTVNYEQAWNKFLSFIMKHLLEKDNTLRGPTQIIISPATVIDQPSHNTLNA